MIEFRKFSAYILLIYDAVMGEDIRFPNNYWRRETILIFTTHTARVPSVQIDIKFVKSFYNINLRYFLISLKIY